MKLLLKYFRFLFILPAVLVILIISTEIKAESDPFPQYSSIQPNIDFWKKIYSEYPSNQGVLHDKQRLDIIYGVIELKNPDLPGGRKINRNRIKAARKKFKLILSKLMRGEPPAGPQEQHVADLFGPDAKAADYRSAIRNIRCQTGQKDRFREGVIRSGAYIEKMKKIFSDSGLPEDFAYLPHVESSFNPKAYSKFGAAGVWQFTRSTGRRYMTIGYTIDERRDPIISSYAAAKLLKANFKKLQNWPMAITAYNHGISGMLRAKRRKGSYEAIFKGYRSRLFKFASRNFYSEFLAAREIAKHYRLHFGELKLDLPVETTEVILDGYASLPDIAHHLQLDLTDISKLNPALRKPVVRGQKYVPKGYRLQLPADTGQDWQALIAELSPKLFKNFQKRSRIYTVQHGDTAGAIAKIHAVKLPDLIAANNLDSRATIYRNQNLRIPLPDEKPVLIAKLETQKAAKKTPAKSSDASPVEGRALETPSVDLLLAMNSGVEGGQAEDVMAADNSSNQPAKAQTELELSPVIASVKPYANEDRILTDSSQLASLENETRTAESGMLAGIEPYYGEEEEIVESAPNIPLESDRQKETSPVLSDLETGYAQDNETADSHPPKPVEMKTEPKTAVAKPAVDIPGANPLIVQAQLTVERIWYVRDKPIGQIRVEVEETLGHYAEWLGVTAWEIRRLNGFSYGRMIHLDQQIKIPLHHVTREEFEEKRFEYHKELSEDFFASYRIEKVEVYFIKRGDNIWTLSRDEFEVPLWLIRRFNADMDFNALMPSQKLLIPIVQKIA
jgi:membrane-bound lytic murein transglycosylase D